LKECTVQTCSYRETGTQIALVLPHVGWIRNKNMMTASIAMLSSKHELLYILKSWCHRAPSLATGDEGMI